MTWHLGSSWDRIKTTLRNEYYTSEVRPHVREISKICERIESQARLISQHQLQITSERVQKLGIRFEIVLEQAMSDQRVMADDVDKRLQELKELIIGQCSHNNVAAMAEQQMYDADLANAAGKSLLKYPFLIILPYICRQGLIETQCSVFQCIHRQRGIHRLSIRTDLVSLSNPAHHRVQFQQILILETHWSGLLWNCSSICPSRTRGWKARTTVIPPLILSPE